MENHNLHINNSKEICDNDYFNNVMNYFGYTFCNNNYATDESLNNDSDNDSDNDELLRYKLVTNY